MSTASTTRSQSLTVLQGRPKIIVVVVLYPEVAEVFETPDSVNEILRALIDTMLIVVRPASKLKRTQSAA